MNVTINSLYSESSYVCRVQVLSHSIARKWSTRMASPPSELACAFQNGLA